MLDVNWQIVWVFNRKVNARKRLMCLKARQRSSAMLQCNNVAACPREGYCWALICYRRIQYRQVASKRFRLTPYGCNPRLVLHPLYNYITNHGKMFPIRGMQGLPVFDNVASLGRWPVITA
jgi:hypothetical protein